MKVCIEIDGPGAKDNIVSRSSIRCLDQVDLAKLAQHKLVDHTQRESNHVMNEQRSATIKITAAVVRANDWK